MAFEISQPHIVFLEDFICNPKNSDYNVPYKVLMSEISNSQNDMVVFDKVVKGSNGSFELWGFWGITIIEMGFYKSLCGQMYVIKLKLGEPKKYYKIVEEL